MEKNEEVKPLIVLVDRININGVIILSKIQRAKNFIIHQLVRNKIVSLDYLSKEISNNIGCVNLSEPISQLRRTHNYIIGLSEDCKNYILLQKLDGHYLFENGYADRIACDNNKYSSKEIWKVFLHEDGYYYFDKQFLYKDIPLTLIQLDESMVIEI